MIVPAQPRVSVICNTLDRADALGSMLSSLQQLTYPNVEVVVVAGPCQDHTDEVLDRWAPHIKIRRCPEPNLSMSRNIGIAAAAGEIVAFIDDDGIAEPSWLDELVAMYDSDEVAGAGGVAFDHTGYTYQCRFSSVDRMGNARWNHEHPLDTWCSPGGWEVPYTIGTNATFRRDRLVEVGGFDEEFEYYLDESDVCMRLVDAGYLIRQSPHAPVHHKFLSSRIRDPHRITLNLFPIIKNKIYFSMVNGRLHASLTDIFGDNARFARRQRRSLRRHHTEGSISREQLIAAEHTIERGWEIGVSTGTRGRQVLLGGLEDGTPEHEFRPFKTSSGVAGRMRVCLVSQTLPPDEIGGISRYISNTARALARRGHEVRVITNGTDHSTVDLEDGVWIHRILKNTDAPAPVLVDDPPERVWSNASAVADEIVRISRHRPVDVVYGALWDAESLAVLERSAVPVVTSLVTTIAITLEMRPEWRQDQPFLRDYLTPLIATERSFARRSHLIHALSQAVAAEVERTSDLELDPAILAIAPLGATDMAGVRPPRAAKQGCEILFVGRFEKRKGIDLVLGALPDLLTERTDVRVVLVGRDDLPGESGQSYRSAFEHEYGTAPWFGQVEFRGVVDDDALWAAYRECDVFVAPSRFESFGLIFVEAMMCAKPVVALRLGAATEVVDNGITGLLVADDVAEVRAALTELVEHPDRRVAMGMAGRATYERNFTVDAMGERIERLLRAVRRLPVNENEWTGATFPVPLPDGTPGIELGHGEVRCAVPDEGALFLSLWMPASLASPVLVRCSTWEEKVAPPRGDAFVHVRVPGLGPNREISVSGPSGAAIAGLILCASSAGGSE